MSTYEDAPEGVFRWRFKETLKDVERLKEARTEMALREQRQDNRLDAHDKDLSELRSQHADLVEHLDQVNQTLNRLLLTIAGSAVTIAMGVLIATGKVL